MIHVQQTQRPEKRQTGEFQTKMGVPFNGEIPQFALAVDGSPWPEHASEGRSVSEQHTHIAILGFTVQEPGKK